MFVRGLHEIDKSQVAAVGGKAAHLGELTRIDGVRVPDGFCVTTDAFDRVIAAAGAPLDELARLRPDDREAIRTLSAQARRAVDSVAIPAGIGAAITRAVVDLGELHPYAVRSSATAEDLPGASFAGQQDTYLNVVGLDAIHRHVSRCWASLFTERAVTYRLRNGFDQRRVRMAVVVQLMVFPRASGILFTADPVSGNRRVATVDAGFGLGEALVSGLVNPDVFRVRDGEVIDRAIAVKQRAVQAVPGGGTREVAVEDHRQERPALTDEQAVELVRLGRHVEEHFARPQDIEWCLDETGFRIVQSRPITTLFPIPEAGDDESHVYVSVGHQQMMTDAMRPLGISCWQRTAMAPFVEAGGRLFVDVTARLGPPASRAALLEMMGKGDPLVADALRTVLDRGFVPPAPDPAPAGPPSDGPHAPAAPIPTDPAVVAELIERSRADVTALRRDLAGRTGPDLFDFLSDAFEQHKRLLADPRSMQAIMAGMDATWWLNDHLEQWLGERNAADTLTLSAPGNVTSEMGLTLLDVADAIRPHPELVAALRAGASPAEVPAVRDFLDRYGMRCAGEIDITRPRWSEAPETLVPLILDNVRAFPPGEAARRFEQGRQAAAQKEQEVLERLRALPDGEEKAATTKQMIDRVRTFIGYREHPKYWIISRYAVYKQAIMAEAGRLVDAGVLRTVEEVFFLSFDELRDVVRTGTADHDLVDRRAEAFRSYTSLTPPRVLTSEGECLDGAYRRDDLPPGALAGLPVSAGTVEGRARVVLDLARADLQPGDILVTTFTDPSWSPLFVAVAGLVTEIGGLMTHGAVIAREYGLPAVVGVAGATRLIEDGQRIRVHGVDGYVELL